MAGKDEISSTEKLLDLIREDADQKKAPSERKASGTEPMDPSQPEKQAQKPDADDTEDDAPTTRSAPLFSNVIPMRKRTTVGVDIG